MRFHVDGFRTGDPSVHPAGSAPAEDLLDVLIVGCGPAGPTLAAQLAAFPEIRTRIVEQKVGPLDLGQAAERAWIAFRDAECAFSASGGEGGSAYPMTVSMCAAHLTTARTEQLSSFLHCKEGDMSCPVPGE